MSRFRSITEVLEGFGSDLVLDLDRALPRSADASGRLRGSIRFDLKILGVDYQFKLKLEDYYKFADKGRKPGKMPPVSKIREWMQRKPAHLWFKKPLTGAQIKGLDINSASWAKARAISKRGVKGTNFYTKTVTQARIDKLKADLEKALKRDVDIELKDL